MIERLSSNKTIAILGAALVIVATAMLAFGAGMVVGNRRDPPPPTQARSLPMPGVRIGDQRGPPPLTGAQSLSMPGVDRPELSDEEKKKAIDILNRDAKLAAALVGTEFTVENIGPWTSERRIIGVAVELQLASAKDIVMNWPYVEFVGFRDERAVYERLSYGASAFSVTRISALIDLNSREVVSLSPTVSESVSIEEVSGENDGADDTRD